MLLLIRVLILLTLLLLLFVERRERCDEKFLNYIYIIILQLFCIYLIADTGAHNT